MAGGPIRPTTAYDLTPGRDGKTDDHLSLAFTAGPDGPYENWEVVGPRGLKIVGLPGGGEPAIWDGRTDQK
jgi:hypothetical protein